MYVCMSTYTERLATLLYRQGEEPTVTGAYMISTPTYPYLGTTQQHTDTRAAAQINPNKETSNHVVWMNVRRPQAKY
jgi:hypothetical protein